MKNAHEDAAEAGVDFLDELFERMELDVEVEIGEADEDEAVVFELTGGVDVLKRRPDLMSAITMLASQAIGNASGERIRAVLDLEGRYAARKSLLEVVARDVADAVHTTGRRGVLDSLSSTERRVVHTALAEDGRVETRSEGDPEHRLLLVEPA